MDRQPRFRKSPVRDMTTWTYQMGRVKIQKEMDAFDLGERGVHITQIGDDRCPCHVHQSHGGHRIELVGPGEEEKYIQGSITRPAPPLHPVPHIPLP